MRLSDTSTPSRSSSRVRSVVIEPAWEQAAAATWREIAIGLVEADRSGAYREAGWRCRDIAQYAEWEYGFTPVQTEELLRIGRKLLDLPVIDRACCDGRLTWEHVLLLTRVAVPKHERAWLALALDVPLVELAHVVGRSAEGWAPPVAGDLRAEGSGAALRRGTEAFDAVCRRRHAEPPRGGFPIESALRRIVASSNLCDDSARDPGREHRAPNVRQPSCVPPSTS